MRPRRNIYQSKWSSIVALATLELVLLSGSVSYAHDLVWPGEKLKILYPGAVSFEANGINISLYAGTRRSRASQKRLEMEKEIATQISKELGNTKEIAMKHYAKDRKDAL